MINLNHILGAYGTGYLIKTSFGEYTFTFDVPLVAAGMEALCEQYHREMYQETLKQLPERNVPDSFDQQMAREAWIQHKKEIEENATANGGSVYKRWVKTKQGQLSSMLSALRIKHPDADWPLLNKISAEKPDEVVALMEGLGKALREAVTTVTASLKSKGQDETVKYLEEIVNPLLSGLPE